MKSIRAKIMWLLFISVLVSSILIGTLGIVLTSRVIAKNSNENMNLLCKTNADELDILFAKIEDSVDTLAHFVESELPSADAIKDEAFRREFTANLEKSALHHIEATDNALSVYINYDAAYIGAVDGFLFVKRGDTFERQAVLDVSQYDKDDFEYVGWWHVPVERGEATWLEAYYDKSLEHHLISYIVPIYKNEQLIGVIGADISTDHIENIVKNISVFSSGKAAVLKSDGTVMYHPNFDRGTLIGEGDPGFDGVVEKLSKEERTNELIAYTLNGVEKRIASYKLRNGMLMVCFAPVSEIYQEQSYLIFINTAITVAAILITLFVSFIVSRRLARPIKRLNEAAKHMTDGEFDYTICADTRDEIGELTATFIETREILKHQFHLLDAEAHRDGLTGVGNKSAFMDREAALNQAIFDGNADFAVAVFDVNKLKITNDIFGHMAGDKLLAAVSAHLTASLGAAEIYRLGGDEFVVIMTGEECARCEELVADCIASMKEVLVEGYPECRVSCAYGVSAFDSHTDHQVSDVLRRADKEMYKNKTITKKETFPFQEGAKGIKQLQVEKYCQLLQTLTSSTDDYLFLLNLETGVIRFFGADQNTFDIADGGVLSSGAQQMLRFVHAKDHALIRDTLSTLFEHDAESVDINFRMLNNDTMRWVNCRANVITDETDSHFVVIGRISQNAVKHLYNPLTTLFNKTKLRADLQKGALDRYSCLMLLDIDNLSEINLKHGSSYGDELLQALAEKLESRFSMQQIYHAEKDRFVVLLDAQSSDEAEAVFEEIRAALAERCSVSASVVPNDKLLYVSIENIYDYAVQILNNAKRESLGQIVFYSKDSLLQSISAVELLEELEESVKDGCRGFSLVYQPQIEAENYSIIGAEALLRFTSRSDGVVYPDRFIPMLEQTGLINDVGIWVANQALAQCKKWRQRIPDFKISVNVSSRQLERKRTAAQIIDLLAKHDLPGDALVLEITESTPLDGNEDAFAILDKFRQAGIRIAVDDFGTGYSNLGNLKHIHANVLKVDRVFVRNIQENGYNYNLIHNLIEFSRSNGIKVCMEGVETVDELIVLSGLQPDYFQGYLFDKPCSVELLEAKYFAADTAEYAARVALTDGLNKEARHAPIVRMETKTILQGLNIGLWIIRLNIETGDGELYADETMKKLLGITAGVTPQECYRYWQEHIDEEDRAAVNAMASEAMDSNRVVQGEYCWHHPQAGDVVVRSSARCIEKQDDMITFEGFHRVISDIDTCI